MGRLGAVYPSASVETVIYTPAADIQALVRVTCANHTAGIVGVKVAHRAAAGGPTQNEDYLTSGGGGEAIPSNDSRMSKPFDVSNPQEITVETDTTGVSFQVNGIERAI